MTYNRFHPTAEERREGYTLLAQLAASVVLGPIGPLTVFAARYLYDRRDAIFDRAGAPVQAFDEYGAAVRLATLASARAGGAQSVVSVRPGLTASARALGLREGDPVGLVLTGQDVRTRSGLVVPARIGDQVSLTVPRGTYSLGAFAGRRDRLFATPHPFTTVDGRTITLGGRGSIDLSLTTPRPTAAQRLPAPGGPPAAGLLATPPAGGFRVRQCPRCGRLHPVTWVNCRPPRVRPGTPDTWTARAVPTAPAPLSQPQPTCWWCGLTHATCDCLVGEARRFWNGG
ncbi:hypothetical protein FHS29_002013 [Saccharothrix tamanrassetensis]|uniref:Uncharacterized protein n=1 Tax=Saccharothrix tamanrassetensis TaxID=1051531 RepID=A0A841CA92_9PSEU|nr:hypothetical protein [Saccharothrix tamanrassetensis]MBB5955432.1 hypothetical protein [Saccharothrix tamanrassetensis]